MPTYEYRCPDGHEFEHFVLKISQAASELPCPRCAKPAARRISAGGGLVFKGSGFYITTVAPENAARYLRDVTSDVEGILPRTEGVRVHGEAGD